MKFNSQICTTREQSERLLALGLKKETADMTLQVALNVCYTMPFQEAVEYFENRHLPPHPTILPAWSLHRLLCLLPTEYIADIDFQQVMQDFVFRSQDMYDEVISCIETLSEAGYFYEEYLEE
jgi:hypothetical protein